MTPDRRSGPNVRPLGPDDALRHVEKAQQYLRAALAALHGSDLDAAAGNAVIAGINAADCVSGLVQGNRWNGVHEQASAHVRKAGPDGRAIATHLGKLMRQKTQAHYEAVPIRARQARELVQAAERAVAVAERVAARHARS